MAQRWTALNALGKLKLTKAVIYISEKRKPPIYESDPEKLGRLMGYNLRVIRQARKWSINTLADRSGIPACTVQRLEKAVKVTSQLATWIPLCNALGVQMEDLLTPRLTFREPTEDEKAKQVSKDEAESG